MKAIVSAKDFRSALQSADKAVAARSTIAALCNVRLEVANGLLTVTGNNNEVSVSRSVACEAKEDGVCVPPLQQLSRWLSLVEGRVSVSLCDDMVRMAAVGSDDLEAVSEPADEFPLPPEAAGGGSITTTGAELSRVLSAVSVAVPKKETGQYVSTGLLFRHSDGRLVVEGTDTKLVLAVELPGELAGQFPDGVILPLAAAEVMAGEAGNGEVVLAADKHVFVMTAADRVVTSRQMYGRFPPWQDVLARQKRGVCFPLDAASFDTGVKRASVMADEVLQKLSVVWEPDRAVMQSGSERGRSRSVVPVAGCQFDRPTAFLPKYLTAVCKAAIDSPSGGLMEAELCEHVAMFRWDGGSALMVMMEV